MVCMTGSGVRRSPRTSISVPLIVRSSCSSKTFPSTDDRLSLHFKLSRSAILPIFECIDKICTQVGRESLNNTYLRYLCHLCVTVCAAIIPPTGSNDLSEMYTSICSWYVATLGLHLGISAKLRFWQVSACKMEPQSGIISWKNRSDQTWPDPTRPEQTRPDHPV